MATVEELKLAIKAEVSDAVSKLKQVERQTKDTGLSVGGLGKTFASLRDTMQGPVAAARMVVQALGQVVDAGKDLYNEYAKAERSQIVFTTAMRDSERITSEGASRLREYAEELQQVTGADDDNTKAIMGNLAAMGKTETQIHDLIEAASNYAAATGLDLDTAVKQLNSTLQGNIGLLGRQNGAVKALTVEQLKNGEAIKVINEQYKGMAEAVGKSAMGASERLNANVGDLKEALGEIVAYRFGPLIENMVNAAKEASDKIRTQTNLEKVMAGEIRDLDKVREAMIELQNRINTFSPMNWEDGLGDLETEYKQLKALHAELLKTATDEDKAREAAIKAEEARKKAAEAEAARTDRIKSNNAAMIASWQSANARGAGYLAMLNAVNKEYKEYTDAIWDANEADAMSAEWKGENAALAVIALDRAREAAEKAPDATAWGDFAEKVNSVWSRPEVIEASKTALEQYQEELKKTTEEYDLQLSIIQAMQDAWGTAMSALGEALVSGEEGWKKWANAGIDAIAAILKGLGAQMAAQAAGALIASLTGKPWEGMAIGPALAGSAAAYAAAGALGALKMAEGGAGTVTKPTLFLAGEAGPEDFAFGPKKKGGLGGGNTIIVQGNMWYDRAFINKLREFEAYN